MFTSSDPASPIRHPQRSLPLFTDEEVDISSAAAFGPYGRDPLVQGCMVRLMLGDTSERRPHCSQAGVADADVVTPLVLEMIEKVADEVDNEILDSQVLPRLAGTPVGTVDEQLEYLRPSVPHVSREAGIPARAHRKQGYRRHSGSEPRSERPRGCSTRYS